MNNPMWMFDQMGKLSYHYPEHNILHFHPWRTEVSFEVEGAPHLEVPCPVPNQPWTQLMIFPLSLPILLYLDEIQWVDTSPCQCPCPQEWQSVRSKWGRRVETRNLRQLSCPGLRTILHPIQTDNYGFHYKPNLGEYMLHHRNHIRSGKWKKKKINCLHY